MYNAAYAALVAGGGGELYMPARTYNLKQAKVNHRNIRLKGEFAGGYVFGRYHTQQAGHSDDGTIINYVGNAGGIAVHFAPLSGATFGLYGCGMEDIQVRGNNLAWSGIRLMSVTDSSFSRLYAEGATNAQMDTCVQSGTPILPTYFNEFRHIALIAHGLSTGLLLAGDWQASGGGRSTSMMSFTRLHVTHEDGIGVKFHCCDNVDINGMACSTFGNGDSLFFNGSGTGLFRAAVGNTVKGFNGQGPIRALVNQPNGARANLVVMNSTDTEPPVFADGPGGLFILNTGGQIPRDAYFLHPQNMTSNYQDIAA